MAVRRFQATLSPAIVNTITTSDQQFTVQGLTGADITASVVLVQKPTAQAGLGIVGARVTSATQINITFVNPTAAGITPTAAEVYQITIID